MHPRVAFCGLAADPGLMFACRQSHIRSTPEAVSSAGASPRASVYQILDTSLGSEPLSTLCDVECSRVGSCHCSQLLIANYGCVLAGKADPFASFDIGHTGDDAVHPPTTVPAGDDAFDMWGQPLPPQQKQPRQPSGQALDPEKLMQPYLSPQSSPRQQQQQQQQQQPAAPAQPAYNGIAFSGNGFSSADNILDSLTTASGASIGTWR